MGDPLKLWVVEISLDKIVMIDPVTGKQTDMPVPFDKVTAPHAISGGYDGAIWLTFLFNNVFGRIDPQTGTWDLIQGDTGAGDQFLVHDYALDWKTGVARDFQGRIWFGDMTRNALGSIDFESGGTKLYDAPDYHGRDNWNTLMYGTVITSDRKHVWYTQLNGNFGSFNTGTLKFETEVEMREGAGPRRLAITENDILYVPLFGAGQIVEYDARARRQIAVHDLPDRGAAPYAVTWDPGRQVLWVATANANAIYRFDPKTRAFGVLPVPKKQGYLRMIQVDPKTGLLATSYANMPERAPGPREALVIDPGDGFTKPNNIVARTVVKAGKARAMKVSGSSRRVSAAEMERLSVSNMCVTCHSVTEPRNGPAFSAIAARYAGRQPRSTVEEVLSAKILYGGAGNWGAYPMIAQDHWLNRDQARELAQAILDLEAEK
jgi:streptogramin lyase/cytochrome c551/c552